MHKKLIIGLESHGRSGQKPHIIGGNPSSLDSRADLLSNNNSYNEPTTGFLSSALTQEHSFHPIFEPLKTKF